MHFFYIFIYFISLHVSSIKCSSSGDRIVLIHHLVWWVCVSDCLVFRSGGNCSSLLTGIPSSHLHRLMIPDDVLIQFDLLMMSTWYPKHVERWYIYIYVYTGCPRRNVPDFGRVFLMLKYTDITQNTYVQIRTVTEIMAREVWNFDSCYTLIDYQIHIKTGRNMWFL